MFFLLLHFSLRLLSLVDHVMVNIHIREFHFLVLLAICFLVTEGPNSYCSVCSCPPGIDRREHSHFARTVPAFLAELRRHCREETLDGRKKTRTPSRTGCWVDSDWWKAMPSFLPARSDLLCLTSPRIPLGVTRRQPDKRKGTTAPNQETIPVLKRPAKTPPWRRNGGILG